MYHALSHAPDKFEGHKVRHDVYRKSSPPKDGIFHFTSQFSGYIRNAEGKFDITNDFQIGYTTWGDRGPICLLLHGVPTNRRAKLPIQELLSPFCRTIAIDMLGMGGEGTSMPQLYGKEQGVSIYDGKPDDPSAWDWVHDTHYVKALMDELYPGERFFFDADDWSGAILSHFIDQYPDACWPIWVDPIAFDGYPVSEIQAFGRAAMIPRTDMKDEDGNPVPGMDDIQFKMAMGAADQTMVQIEKTMVFDPTKYNQYVLKDIKLAYIDVDYERSRSGPKGEDANSLTLRLKYDNMRVLCERSAILSPALALPYDKDFNPKGVDFNKFTGKAQVIWAGQDTMMNHAQLWRFKAVLTGAESVDLVTIDNAGHFVETDQPERVVEAMLSFMSNVVGVGGMGDIFLGYKCIWKGDERQMIGELRQLWNL